MWLLLSVASAADVPLPTTRIGNPVVQTEPGPAQAATPDAAPAELSFDCKVPAEVLVDGVKLGQLWFPGTATWKVAAGHHSARVFVGGSPQELALDLAAGESRTVLVGRSGVTVSESSAAPPVATGPTRVGFRVVGGAPVELRLDDGRQLVQVGVEHVVELTPGLHRLSLRNALGTAIWSTGVLEVTGGTAIVQLSEGRMPEVSGGAVFHSGG